MTADPRITVVILTRDEARHIARAIDSVRPLAARVLVVDSGSTDGTREIARAAGARVLEGAFPTLAGQFNWALGQLPQDTAWVLRLDADEIVMPALAREIAARLPGVGPEVAGVSVGRRMAFLRRPIRHGGVFPIRIVRLFRHGRGRCEARWMDEHILADGPVVAFSGEILDDNLKPLDAWTEKHNAYASREVVDILAREHHLPGVETVAAPSGRGEAGTKRWLKETVYARLPGGLRALAYFLYRYLLRLGFLDGREGAAFHVLQGFWYRYLVDAKLREVRLHMARTGADPETAIRAVLGIEARAGLAPPRAPASPHGEGAAPPLAAPAAEH